ncbi:glycosyltransferase family 29 protein [Autumnicola edwardsiae]|uniref:Glycosyltransferase family 29 protein n=1 Tax=Autumnicola edwardsiae TaxID=3075594 RepID=A0ABU3CTV0_9FLAO|nr:glycosyltransferase family 29 protein [Zunongwangia sp. F297]MDT0649784.1 glycosyltransferase family 29 protein [Zunongwangia sp. F297]
MKFKRNLYAFYLMVNSLKTFVPEEGLKGKRVAIVGAADSVFKERNGKYIDDHDVVVRINKSPHTWRKDQSQHVGSKFTLLYHSFFENDFSGGGKIDWNMFKEMGIQKVINPNPTKEGLLAHFNYYKRHFSGEKTYMLKRKNYNLFKKKLKGFTPTVGYAALASILQAECKEIFITGFTFFKTPYAGNYRPGLEKMDANKEHIQKQGLHNPNFELKSFKHDLLETKCKKVILDKELEKIMEGERV